MRLNHSARTQLAALILVRSGCFAGTQAVHKQPDTEQGSPESGPDVSLVTPQRN